MANREALRELQSRLATRLKAAKAEGVSVAWLAVKAGGHHYLLPLSQSGEIFSMTNLQPVPHVREWFRGVLNIRGGLYGVVDLAAFVADSGGIPRTGPPAADASVVTLNPLLEVNCALQVDNLAGLRGAEAFKSSALPDAASPAYFGNRFVDTEGVQWQEINLRSLSQFPPFLSISA
jgi:twitching motility protein PilI